MAPGATDSGKFWPAAAFAAAVLVPVSVFSAKIAGASMPRPYPYLWALFTALAGFFILYTGRVAFYRRVFYSAAAVLFLLHFKLGLFSAFESSCRTDTPYCHIAVASSFLNYMYQQYLALMSGDWRLWGPLSAAFLWLFFTLVLGRAWCSWACFYGGLDDGLAALPKRALIGSAGLAGRFRDFPAALLIFLLLVSLGHMLPIYCLWGCPFKLTAVFLDQDAFVRKLQLGLMYAALAALVLAPLLTKKRTFCSFLCPFGAWQAFFGRLNPFRMSADPAKCTSCGLCVDACPMSAIRCGADGKAENTAYCNLCGQCRESCPREGFHFTVFGLPGPGGAGFRRLLSAESFLVFSALLTGGTFAALFAPAALKDMADIVSGLWN